MDNSRSDKPPEDDLHGRKYVERVLRDTVRKVVESGVEKIAEGPENLRSFVADLKLPKEIANYLLSQIDETKSGLYRVVGRELQGFLQHTNVGDEIARALQSMTIEIKTEIRFASPTSKPEVKAAVEIKSDRPER
jgi:hypothetical protein